MAIAMATVLNFNNYRYRKVREESEMSELLPPEIWTEILVRLPVTTLLSLKCVSNSFLSLIQNPNFAHLHFSRFNNKNPNDSGLLLFDRVSVSELGVYRGNALTRTLEFKIISNKYDRVVCYVSGLFWLYRFDLHDAILCNPSIRKSITIPFPSSMKRLAAALGFGYDPGSNDYKAVMFCHVAGLLEVYSLRLGCWRNFQVDPIPSVFNLRRNVYANGAIHWLVGNQPPEFYQIISFDLGSEVFSYRQLPQHGDDHPFEDNVKLPLSFRGSLAVLYIAMSHICVWVLTENGWNKECMMQSNNTFFHFFANSGYFNSAIFCEETSELVIAGAREGVIFYNINTQDFTRSAYDIAYNFDRVDMYVESLLWSELLPSTS